MRFRLHGHFSTRKGWKNWFLNQGFRESDAELLIELLLDKGWFREIKYERAGREVTGYYPQFPSTKKGFRICHTEELMFFIKNKIYGHIIYRPLERAKFKVGGVKKLTEYLEEVGKEETDQKRRDHPLALEVICVYNLDRRLDMNSPLAGRIIRRLVEEVQGEGFGFGSDDFAFGIEYEEEIERVKDYFEGVEHAEKRYSYNGEDWTEIDITDKIGLRL
ncbi:hypothetical protein J7L33_04865 [Candidatus Bathyarchaeota archaeon]|nr:hypothetical protein [Candidatus Bathyarchaeota archaeon]